MLKKYAVLLLVLTAIALLWIAALNYPGGSQADKNAIGYSWKNNYISNLFAGKAINSAPNTARFWAIGGMLFLSAGFALFFVHFAKKIPVKGAASIIRYSGVSGMLFCLLITTPLHDVMVSISSTLFLVSLFYSTVFIFKSKLHLFKFLCVICLLFLYATLYLYGSGTYWEILPVMQKLTFLSVMMLVIGLEYFTGKEDFQHLKPVKRRSNQSI